MSLFFDFFALVDTSSVNEAFTGTSTGGNPMTKLTAALFIILLLVILSGKEYFEISIPRNWKQLREYLKSVWYDEERHNPPP